MSAHLGTRSAARRTPHPQHARQIDRVRAGHDVEPRRRLLRPRRRGTPRGLALGVAFLAVVMGGALALLLAVATAHAETLALTGATVHTVSGPTIENGTVVIQDGKILAVGQGVGIPAGARMVSCSGKHVYPGMIAPHTILGLIEINSVRGTVDYQELGDVNPHIRAEVAVNPESELLPVARANGITSAVVSPRGGAIAGTMAVMHLDGWTYEDMTVKAPLGLYVQWPAMSTVRSFNEQRSAEEQKKAREQTIENLHTAFHEARAYGTARAAEGAAGIPRHDRDVKWDALGRAVRGEIPVFFAASTLAQIRAVLRFADEHRLAKVVLVGGEDSWRVAADLKQRHIPVITGGVLESPRRRHEAYDQAFTVPLKLHEAGIRFCISDGGSANDATMTRNLPYHAGMAAAFGLPRDEALKSVTLYPAQILGLGDRLGSIEPGKIADLIVTDGDPLEITTQVEQVLIAGVPTSMENRQTRLFEKYDHRPRGAKARKR
jgi:imidazolonepropionase-like amidohydrolase